MASRWWLILIVLRAVSCRQPIADEVIETSGAQNESTDKDASSDEQEASSGRDDTEVLEPDPEAYHPGSTPDRAKAGDRIVAFTNQLRAEKELTRLTVDPTLQKTATDFAGYMARSNRYGHRADGKDPAERVRQLEYEPCLVDENIAYAFRTRGFSTDELANEFFEGWKKSPGHLKNMLDPDVTQTAVAIAEGEGGYFFAVQLLGRPESEMIGFKLTNGGDAEFEYEMGDETFKLIPRQTRTHQACRPQHLEFVWHDAEGTDQTVAPHAGDHFVATGEGDGFQVRKK